MKSNMSNGSNLEKAYEDLDREIKDIKSKLQRSMGSVGGGPSEESKAEHHNNLH